MHVVMFRVHVEVYRVLKLFFFFFKQKTAYEMRISDWSSDVCSSDLHNAIRKAVGLVTDPNDPRYRVSYLEKMDALLDRVEPVTVNFGSVIGERTDRKSVV